MNGRDLFRTRRLEVFVASYTLGFGFWLMLPFQSMNTAAFATLTEAVSEYRWGALFFFNGLSHALALIINGHRWWSPFVRWFAALTSALVYAAFSIGFGVEHWHSTAVFTYAGLSCAGLICLWFAVADATQAMRIRHLMKGPANVARNT